MPLDPISIPVRSIAAKITAMMIDCALAAGDKAKAERVRLEYADKMGEADAP